MYKGDRTRWLSEMRHPELVAQYRFVRAKRRCEYWAEKSKIVYLCVRFIYEHYKVKYNTDIPARCKIGGVQNTASRRNCFQSRCCSRKKCRLP